MSVIWPERQIDDLSGQIADIDPATWSKHVEKYKFSKSLELSSKLFMIYIDRKLAVRRVLRTSLRLYMAKCFQVADLVKHSPLAFNMQIFKFNVNL